ncbi:hypothetical protein HB825_03565 [Listeria booriae]|uniref:hypothetical protein n=1 Tax=Listeria booriae TaxID=1552123 RepID=UPI00164DF633|nr:hypothetical protein [Listeria booriae]MBC6133909.1 hypothetical protein [Listeria booriae]
MNDKKLSEALIQVSEMSCFGLPAIADSMRNAASKGGVSYAELVKKLADNINARNEYYKKQKELVGLMNSDEKVAKKTNRQDAFKNVVQKKWGE